MRRLNDPNIGIALTILAAIGSVFFTVAASTFVYRNTKDLIVAEGWVEHSQEVLTGLQSATQRLDRIEAQAQLFVATNDQDHLTSAESDAISLGTASTHIRSLVFDNPDEIREVTALSACTRTLTSHLELVQTTGKLPKSDLLRCRQILSHMSELERRLLKQRAEASREHSQRSVMSELGLGSISLLVLSILFGLLVRDAVRRMRMTRKTGQMNLELATTITVLKNRAEESHRLTLARDELQLCTTLEQVYCAAVNSFGHLARRSKGSLCMINNSVIL